VPGSAYDRIDTLITVSEPPYEGAESTTTNNAQLDPKLRKFRVASGASERPAWSARIAHQQAASGVERVGERVARLLRRDDLRDDLVQAHRQAGGVELYKLGRCELACQ
jgi:hypothetical protein